MPFRNSSLAGKLAPLFFALAVLSGCSGGTNASGGNGGGGNQPRSPVANAGGPYSGKTETPLSFSGSGSSDPQKESLTYAWTFGDGSTGTGVSPSHVYTAAGAYTVSLTVTDSSSLTATATATTTIAAQPPVANAGGPYVGNPGASIRFSGSGSSDPQHEPLTYAWTFGDGSTGAGVNPTHVYPALGSYPVSLTVTNTSNLTATATSTTTIEDITVNIQGAVSSGQQPVSGTVISLYTAGHSGNGSAATPVATLSTPVLTDSSGSFTLLSDYTCINSNDQMYLVATGGNPGLAAGTNNSALVMMAALGRCDQLSKVTAVTLNEVTTVAAAWALSQFLSPGANLGASATNALGLGNAVITASNLASIVTGSSPGAVPANVTVSTAKLNTLANALASCVNSAGGASCAPLFSAATAGGITPANTLDAALNVARNPGSNVGAIYTLAAANTVFGPALTAAPPDWMLYSTLTGGGLDNNSPASIAVDSVGNIWVSTYFGAIAKFSPNGTPATATGFTGSGINQSYGMALDASDNVWIANQQTTPQSGSGTITKLNSSGQPLSGPNGITAGGIYFPGAVATDTNGNVWIANYGDSEVTLLNNSGAAISPAPGFGTGFVALPRSIAVDANHNAWVGDSGVGPIITRISPDGSQGINVTCCDQAAGIALDGQNNVWTANFLDSSVSLITNTSAAAPTVSGNFTGHGLYTPNGIAVDGAGDVWVTNYHGVPASLTELGGVNGGVPGAFLSPATGFGSDASLAEPYGIAVDASGNLWVSNAGASNTVTEFIGAAVPVKTPLVGPSQVP